MSGAEHVDLVPIASIDARASAVKFLSDYLDYRPTNVLGVQELIKVAVGSARVYAPSRMSIYAPGELADPRITEDQIPAPHQVARDGYNRSKYVLSLIHI